MDVRGIMSEIRGSQIEDVLVQVATLGGSSHLQPIEQALGIDRRDLGGVSKDLRDLGLAHRETSMAGEVDLTHHGKRVAEEVRQSRAHGQYRVDAVQVALLQWLQTASPKSVDEFIGHDDATAYGQDFSEAELVEAAQYLEHKDLIRGIAASGSPTVLRPDLTPEGRAVLRSGRPVSEALGAATPPSFVDRSNSTTVGGNNYGAVQTGTGNEQHMTVTLTQQQRGDVSEEVASLLQQLEDRQVEGAQPLREALQELRTLSESPTATEERVRSSIGLAIATAAATAGTDFVVSGLADLLSAIAGSAT